MTKIEHQSLSDRAYGEIRKGLITGLFAPMQPLVIRSLAESYGISATPIREALQRLVAERLLVALPNRSIVVPAMTQNRFRELFPIRAALEGLATQLATPQLTKADKVRMARLLERIAETTTSFDARSYMKLNREFHFLVYEKSGNPELLRLIQDMWLKVGPVFNGLFDDDHYRDHANDKHLDIYNAIIAGNATHARQAMEQDLLLAAQSLLPRLPDQAS
ncbi:GntR family transcriptional regulator [Roseovarius aestuarii]|nr:GntR family transcriptional regulator [Roseovarius aestuarii]